MKKTALLLSLLTGGLFFVAPATSFAESIKSFDVVVEVHTDNAVTVSETIVYDSDGAEKHGIFRTIRRDSSEGRRMHIVDVSVEDQFGTPYQFERQTTPDVVTLKIGDPNSTFSGEKTYVLSYRAEQAVVHLDRGIDEIYWNTTGNEWSFTIEKATAKVVLPEGAAPQQRACYVGASGSTENCLFDETTNTFVSGRALSAGEGMTVAVGFPAGIVAPYPPKTFLEMYGVLLGVFSGALLAFVLLLSHWKKYGRDPKGSGVIVAQYDVPDRLTPMEVGVIVYEKARSQDIAAQLIYLATQGFLKIRQIEKKTLGIFRSTDYELTLLKDTFQELTDTDRKIIAALFSQQHIGAVVLLSSLENKFYTSIPSITRSALSASLSKGYYKNLPGASKGNKQSFLSIFLSVVFIFLLPLVIMKTVAIGSPVLFLVVLIISLFFIISFVVFQYLMPAKTEKGVAVKEHILGLREYLRIAEKDRLAFHNAPEKKPELFERLLPFALVLGVEKSWAKEFETLYTVPPSWYEGSSQGAFSVVAFTQSMNSFSASAFSTLTHSPRSSGGSGGGGSSGGGGGGGGGGSW